MANKPSFPEYHCPECGADVRGFCDYCWLCNHPLAPPEIVDLEPAAPPVAHPNFLTKEKKSTDALLVVVTLVGTLMILQIGVSLLSYDVTLGLTFWVLAVPALIAIAATLARRGKQEATVTSIAGAVGKAFLWVGVAIGAIVMMTIAGVVMLFIVCIGALALAR